MKKTLLIITLLLSAVATLWAQTGKFDAEVAAFEAQDKATPPPANPIVFVGSSSIRLWNGLPGAFADKPVVQRGFGGAELGDVIRYAPRVINPYKPKQIVLYAGDNDIGQSNKSAREVYGQFTTFFALMRKLHPSATITFIAIKPSPARKQFLPVQAEANSLIKAYVNGQKNASFADVYAPMLGADGQPRPDLFQADGLHLNEQGYALWKQVIGPLLK